jgi:hypothetical protein|tara:strand:- start:317 stop:436 length:120 start_codon:yes stop_codon:yes gene_type:complete
MNYKEKIAYQKAEAEAKAAELKKTAVKKEVKQESKKDKK